MVYRDVPTVIEGPVFRRIRLQVLEMNQREMGKALGRSRHTVRSWDREGAEPLVAYAVAGLLVEKHLPGVWQSIGRVFEGHTLELGNGNNPEK